MLSRAFFRLQARLRLPRSPSDSASSAAIDPYLTMSAEYESVIAGAFVDFLDRGYVYKGLKPVDWCIRERTALCPCKSSNESPASIPGTEALALPCDAVGRGNITIRSEGSNN
jgi:hypothetical protein